MTFDLHPPQVSNSYSTAQLQCDTGSKEAEVKIRKMLNKHMVGPKDSDSLLSVLLATPTAKTPSVEKFLSHCATCATRGLGPCNPSRTSS